MIEVLAHANDLNEIGQNADTLKHGWGMMGGPWMMGSSYGLGGVFSIVIWILTVLVLVALLRWLWTKGNPKESKKK